MQQTQFVVEVSGFVTVTVPVGTNVNDIPMKIDVFTREEDPSSPVLDVNDTDILTKSVNTEVPLGNLCKNGHSLEESGSVIREYISKEEGGKSKFSPGYYNKEGEFEPIETINLSDGRYDLVDGSDKCTCCKVVVG